MKRHDFEVRGWSEYELLDSGEGRKLERFGEIVLDRPDPQAIWQKRNKELWVDAHAQFIWAEKGERWKVSKDVPETWRIGWRDIRMNLSFKGFKHIGIFPEHMEQWKKIADFGAQNPGSRMLNLFGYTGAASIAGRVAGLEVTHVDASKQTVQTVRENAESSKLPADAIRFIVEDSIKYVRRLIARGETFEVISMDPPAFGRGPKGEIWKIEESLTELISLIPQILSKQNKRLVVLNGYAAGYSARTFAELLASILPREHITYGDIGILESNEERILSTGIYSMFEN